MTGTELPACAAASLAGHSVAASAPP